MPLTAKATADCERGRIAVRRSTIYDIMMMRWTWPPLPRQFFLYSDSGDGDGEALANSDSDEECEREKKDRFDAVTTAIPVVVSRQTRSQCYTDYLRQ